MIQSQFGTIIKEDVDSVVRELGAQLEVLGGTTLLVTGASGFLCSYFVDVVVAPKPEAVLAFSVWYSSQGLGRIQSMPAFEAKAFETAIKDAAD